MKLLYFDDFKLGVLKGDSVVDVSSVGAATSRTPGPGDLINGLIERFDEYRGTARGGRGERPGRAGRRRSGSARRCRSRPTSTAWPSTTWRTARAASRRRSTPSTSRRARSSATATRWCCPTSPATIFEGEAELALVIGKRASNVKAADAMDYIFGYIELHRRLGARPAAGRQPFYQMKSRDTFAPIGPYLVTADEIPDPQKLQVRLWDNGTLDAELQHQRHGAQDPALHRVGDLDPHAGAGRHPRHRHQPPRPQPVPWTATRSSSRSKASAGSPST